MKLFRKQRSTTPWNKGHLIGQKPPLKLKEIWVIRFHLHLKGLLRDLALFNMAIDSKLRACDLVSLKLPDIFDGTEIKKRALVLQLKTARPVRFEISNHAREAVLAWVKVYQPAPAGYLFPSRIRKPDHLSTRQYARRVKDWVRIIALDPARYGTHSLRRTKVSLIYKETKNLRAVQLLLGHSKLESTVRYLGVDVDDALEVAEQIEI